jgi:predicted GTPase
MQTAADPLEAILDELAAVDDTPASAQAGQLRDRLQAGELRVALVGEAKRGKSTFGNALLGEEILPTGVVPVTSISTEVRAGTTRQLNVVLEDGTERTADVLELPNYVSERLNPHNRRRVTKVTLSLPTRLPHPQMVLIDTPGVGSVFRHNTAVAREAYDAMDAAVFVLTADPPISDSEVSLLREVAQLSVRVFVVLNKVDQLEPDESAESMEFVSDVLARVLGGRPAIWPCSARQGLRARVAEDESGWRASGMADFVDALVSHLQQHRARDLRVSVVAAASRLAARQLDGLTLTLASVEALETDQQDRVAEFGRRLQAIDRRRDEAVELVAAHMRRVRRELDEDYAAGVAQTSVRVREVLEAFLGAAGDLRPVEVERRAREVIAEATRPAVEAWCSDWYARLQRSYGDLADRLQALLIDAGGDLREAAWELLGVRLRSSMPVLALPELPALRFDFGPDVGWNHALISGLRTHTPARIARRRVEGYLRDELARIIDKHLGRARSELQVLLEDTVRRLQSELTAAFAELTQGLRAGQESALALYRRQGASRRSEQERLAARRATLIRIDEELRCLARESTPLPEQVTGAGPEPLASIAFPPGADPM